MGGRNNMSLAIPTDSLNKFLAIGSLVVLLTLLNLSISNYEKAELSRIETLKLVLEYKNSCTEFCDETKKLYNDFKTMETKYNELKNSKSIDSAAWLKVKKENERILKRKDELAPLMKKAKKLELDTSIAIQKMNLYYWMRNIWFSISIISLIVFSFTSYIGFKGWYKSEEKV